MARLLQRRPGSGQNHLPACRFGQQPGNEKNARSLHGTPVVPGPFQDLLPAPPRVQAHDQPRQVPADLHQDLFRLPPGLLVLGGVGLGHGLAGDLVEPRLRPCPVRLPCPRIGPGHEFQEDRPPLLQVPPLPQRGDPSDSVTADQFLGGFPVSNQDVKEGLRTGSRLDPSVLQGQDLAGAEPGAGAEVDKLAAGLPHGLRPFPGEPGGTDKGAGRGDGLNHAVIVDEDPPPFSQQPFQHPGRPDPGQARDVRNGAGHHAAVLPVEARGPHAHQREYRPPALLRFADPLPDEPRYTFQGTPGVRPPLSLHHLFRRVFPHDFPAVIRLDEGKGDLGPAEIHGRDDGPLACRHAGRHVAILKGVQISWAGYSA